MSSSLADGFFSFAEGFLCGRLTLITQRIIWRTVRNFHNPPSRIALRLEPSAPTEDSCIWCQCGFVRDGGAEAGQQEQDNSGEGAVCCQFIFQTPLQLDRMAHPQNLSQPTRKDEDCTTSSPHLLRKLRLLDSEIQASITILYLRPLLEERERESLFVTVRLSLPSHGPYSVSTLLQGSQPEKSSPCSHTISP